MIGSSGYLVLRVPDTRIATDISGLFLLGGPLAAATPGSDQGSASDPRGPSMASGSRGDEGTQQERSLVKQLPDRYKLSNWMGKSVQTPGGENVGTVEELVMDDVGRVRYVVLKSKLAAEGEDRDMIYLSQEKTRLFEKLDDNENGVIDREEAQDHERLSEQFSEVDTFGNEAVTRSELAAFEIEGEDMKARHQGGGGPATDQGKAQPGS